tara:strand:+ start:1014 stop:1841 length:828 start_codon:yes stop_codon:yes gene_type:complete
MSPFLQTIGGGSAKGFKGSGGGVLLGGDESNPAATAQAILDAGASQGDGVYWITVNGTARQMYCDMTSGGKAWMATYRVDADGQSSCANGTWDFNAQSNFGGASPPTTAVGQVGNGSNGQGEGLSYSNRYSFWQNTPGLVGQVLLWSGRGNSPDIKVEMLSGVYNTQNPITGYAYGLPNQANPSSYFNTTIGTNKARVRYTSGWQTGLTVNSDYQWWLLGGWNCGCCESVHLNGNWDDTSTNASMPFGDGKTGTAGGNNPNSGQRAFEWCTFFVR